MPIARQRSSCSGLLTTSRAKISPFRQRIAAAVSTPSGAPPMPMTACTPLPTTAAAMPAERSPSEIRRMRAPAARISLDQLLVARPVEHDHDQVLDVALEAARDRLQVLRDRRVQADRVLGARADDQLLHVEIGRVQQAAARRRREHGDRVGRAGGAQVRALERIDRDVDLGQSSRSWPSAPPADLLADEQHRRLVALALADDDRAVDRHRVHALRAWPRPPPGRTCADRPGPSCERRRSRPARQPVEIQERGRNSSKASNTYV